jgi:hypothetical protein
LQIGATSTEPDIDMLDNPPAAITPLDWFVSSSPSRAEADSKLGEDEIPLSNNIKVPYAWKNSPLSEVEKSKLVEVLIYNVDRFATDPKSPDTTNVVEHKIDTGEHPPIYTHPYRVSPIVMTQQGKEIETMLRNGIITPSESPWSSPIVMVVKPDESIRFCVDYRKLNNITRPDRYPLPRIDDTLDSLGQAVWFSTLDLASGYWQINVYPPDREKTAFSTRHGHYEFKVMPFGLRNAPSTFQRLLDRVLAGLLYKICLVYIDDVIIFSRTFEEHLQHLTAVFDRLRKAGLSMKASKCYFGVREVRYLGHIIGNGTIKPDPSNIEA